MSYCAYHVVNEFIGQDHELRHLRKEGASSTYVVNNFFVSSANDITDIESPADALQEFLANKASYHGDSVFTIEDQELDDLIESIRETFPDHEGTEELIAEIKEIKKREPEEAYHEFSCY